MGSRRGIWESADHPDRGAGERTINPWELSGHIALSLVLGGLIGAERQWRQRNAGLRTNTLVSVGSALFVSLSFLVEGETSPTRVAGQVVSGIGFLGGGVILREGLNVRGLNTAATLWCSAATGALCGGGFLTAAVIGTVAILCANVFLRPLAARLNRHKSLDDSEENVIHRLRLVCPDEDEIHVRALILEAARANDFTPRAVATQRARKPGKVRIDAELVGTNSMESEIQQVLTRLTLQPCVLAIRWSSKGDADRGDS